MQEYSTAVIRRIVYGLVQSATEQPYILQVGSNVRIKESKYNYTIIEIIEDKDCYLEYGYFEYLVYVKAEKENAEKRLYLKLTTRPDKIEYYLSEDEIEIYY